MKKLAIILAVAMCLSALFTLSACNPQKTDESFVSIDINPSVEMIVDANGKVTSIYGSNEDGQVLLYGKTSDLEGKDVSQVVAEITDEAAKLGYISENNKVVQFSVSSAKGEHTAKLLSEKVSAGVKATSDTLSFTLTADNEASYALMRRLEQFQQAHPDDEAIANLGFAQFRLALSASETGQITLEAAVHADTDELVAMLSEAKADVEEFATAAYEKAKSVASEAYDKAASALLDSVYSTYYTLHALEHPNTVYYGAVYEAYAFSARIVGAAADVVNYAQKVAATPLTAEQTNAVLAALNLSADEVYKISDDNGNVTIDSIESYANVLFKNSEAGQQLDELKAQLTQSLNQAESEIAAEINSFTEQYSDEIAAVTEQMQKLVTLVESLLPPIVTENVSGVVTELKETLADLSDVCQGFTAADLYEAERVLRERASAMLEKIKADLTEEQLAEVEEIRAAAAEKLASAKQTMENAIAQAEEEARAYLEQLREKRENQA